MLRTALFSRDKKYRYRLTRQWDDKKPMVLFIMHNPSTADAFQDDPTLTRIINYAKVWGFGGLYVGNLFPYCSVKPKKNQNIPKTIEYKNRQHINSMVQQAGKVICAWGNNEKAPQWLLKKIRNPYCISVSVNNIPKHPLYLKKNLQPKPFLS